MTSLLFGLSAVLTALGAIMLIAGLIFIRLEQAAARKAVAAQKELIKAAILEVELEARSRQRAARPKASGDRRVAA